jgi:EAL domain-containing protein (putative c-di-GMP-specific phosphodiesterase class I)
MGNMNSFSVHPPMALEAPIGPFALGSMHALEDGSLAALELPASEGSSLLASSFNRLSASLRLTAPAAQPVPLVCARAIADQLRSPSFWRSLAATCREGGASPGGLCLFFSDSLLYDLKFEGLKRLLEAKRQGFMLGLDIADLSAMSGLQVERLPVDVLRLCPLDVLTVSSNPAARRDVRDFTRFAENLLMTPAARGVSGRDQMDTLRDLGVVFGQGPFFPSLAMPPVIF